MKLASLAFVISLLVTGVAAQTAPPAIFFTDLTSGPNSGGESVNGYSGAYVTIYGNNFGTTAPTVTLNNQNCLRVVNTPSTWLWYQKVTVQLGSGCTNSTGAGFVVTTAAGSSTGAPFTVRAGTIRCVSTTGSNSNNGLFPGNGSGSGCNATMQYAKGLMSAGDIMYVGNGVVQTAGDSYGVFTVPCGGTASSPIAIVAYPGATATIGSASLDNTIRWTSLGCGSKNYVTVAGFTIIGNQSAIAIADCGGSTSCSSYSQGARVIGNDISCPQGNSSSGCVTDDWNPYFYMYGNNVHNSGANGAMKTYHSVYMSGGANHVWIGWNSVHDGGACRGIQFFASDGPATTDLHAHDNLIYNTVCNGLNLSAVDGSSGTVEAYNNVIYHAGIGGGSNDADYACILSNPSAGNNQIYNNTLYNCGSGGTPNLGQGCYDAGGSGSVLRNNICYQVNNQPYLANSNVSGSNNVFYGGSGSIPSGLTGTLTSNPQLANPAGADFHLSSSTSPPNHAGTAIAGLAYDHDGLLRSSPPSIGAYEFASGSVTRPNPPTNLNVVVN